MSSVDIGAFGAQFGAPLLLGKTAVVSTPLGRDGLDVVKHGFAIEPHMQDAADLLFEEAALHTAIRPAAFDEDNATLLFAFHELMATCHPQSSSFYARSYTFCEFAEEAVKALPFTYDKHRLLSRHLLLTRGFRARRTDTDVKWWTGARSFKGVEPPKRLLAMPGLRRVLVDKKSKFLWRIAMTDGDEETRVARLSLLTSMLNTSPLTRLMLLGEPMLKELGFSLMLPMRIRGKRMSPLYLLDDPEIARLVTDTLVDRGVEKSGPPLAVALLQGVRESSPPLVIRWSAELCAHLVLTLCLLDSEAPEAKELKALHVLFDGEPFQLHDSMRVFWSVVSAVISLDEKTFDIGPASHLPDAAFAKWNQVIERLTHPHFEAVAGPLSRELSRRLPPLFVQAKPNQIREQS
ncbi:MAG: hypothetical protein GY822_03860 [Deltaproteobacteria bacterium]|nr:hypothetical protein [Deltaproteobacteria bacterium]